MQKPAIIFIIFLILLTTNLYSQIKKMRIVERPILSKSEIVGKTDVNGRYCAAIKVVSNMLGLAYESYNGVVDLESKPSVDIVYLSSNERVLEIYKTGYEPLIIVLSEHGVDLEGKQMWEIHISGDKETEKISVAFITKPDNIEISINDQDFKKTDTFEVPPGEHIVHLKKSGYKDIQDTISVTKDNFVFKYTMEERTYGRLLIYFQGAVDIDINNKSVDRFKNVMKESGGLVIDGLDFKKYKIECNKKFFNKYTTTVELTEEDNIARIRPKFIRKTTSLKLISENVPANGTLSGLNITKKFSINANDSTIFKIPYDNYKITAESKGYLPYEEEISLISANSSKVNLDFQTPSKLKAVLRSVAFPGWGQRYSQKSIRGNIYSFTTLLSIGYGIYFGYQYENELSSYNELSDKYLNATSVEMMNIYYNDWNSSRNKLENYRRQFLGSLGITALIYSLNLVDISFYSPPDRKITTDMSYNNKTNRISLIFSRNF